MSKRLCPACGDPVCEFCGGCKTHGECTCFSAAKTSTILKQAAQIADLKIALASTGYNMHMLALSLGSKFHSGNFETCGSEFCRDVNEMLERDEEES